MNNKINVYEYFNSLSMEEFFQIMKNAKTDNEKEFYREAWALILKQGQREAIKNNVY